MKSNTVWLLLIILLCSYSLHAGEAGEVRDIKQKITNKEAEKTNTEIEMKKAAQDAADAKIEIDKAETEREELLKKPEGERDQTLIDQLSATISSEQSKETEAKAQEAQATEAKAQLEKDIAALKKEEQDIQQGFTPSGGGDTQLSFMEKLVLKIQQWTKQLSLALGIGDVKQLRSDLSDIYKLLGNPFEQAKNTHIVAQLLPDLTQKIGKDLEALNLLTESSKAITDRDALRAEVQGTVIDLINLKEQLSGENVSDQVTKDTIDATIERALKDIKLSEMQIEQLNKQQSHNEALTGREFIDRFFDSIDFYDDFKAKRDAVVDAIQKDPRSIEKNANYQDIIKTINAFELAQLEQFRIEEQANIASLIKSTYQDLAQSYNTAALEIGKKSSVTPEEMQTMLDLFTKSSDLFERSQAWDISLQDALERGRQEAKDDPDFKRFVEQNNDAKIISPEVVASVQTIPDEISSVKARLDNPSTAQADFNTMLKNIEEFTKKVDSADPSVQAVVTAAQVAQHLIELYNAIDLKTKETTLSQSNINVLARWLLDIQNLRIKLLIEENSNQKDLVQALPNSGIVELPQIKKENIASPKVQTDSGQALLKSIQEGFKLKSVAEREIIKPQQEETIVDVLAKAIAARRVSIGEGEEGDQEEGNGEWD